MVKKALALVLLCCCLSAFVGCQSANRTVEAIVEGDGQFPEFLVGVWEAEVSRFSKWGFKFEPDGSISKIVHSLAGPIRLADGGAYAYGPEESYYVFAMGPCEANYTPGTRMLEVKIIVDHYTMKLPGDVLEGRIEDYFSGQVSEDGEVWKVDWRRYGWLEGSTPPNPEAIEANPTPLVFTKTYFE